jgi:hydroxyacyl-ACP dehydratase HTD2-like protein with hotdog domain
MSSTQRYFEDVTEGMELAPRGRMVSTTQLFLFSAVTRNPHRIHYDREFAATEDHPNVLVHGPLHGAMLGTYVTDWAGPRGRLRRLAYQNRGRATPDDMLVFKGRVTRVYREDGRGMIELDVWEEVEGGPITVPGSAVVELPTRTRDGAA